MASTREHYLVLGGTGFLGSYIVRALIERGERVVAVFEIVEPSGNDRIANVDYYTGDITDKDRLLSVLHQTAATTIFQTAAPVHGLDKEIYYHVNEQGTNTVLSACFAAGVERLAYKSSTGVVWNATDFNGVDEEHAQIPPTGYDAYHHTKAFAEKGILAADGQNGLTVIHC